MTSHNGKSEPTRTVEGEGNYTATRRYNEHVGQHIANNDPEKLAKEAKRALEGDERGELEEAEQRGKRGPSPKP